MISEKSTQQALESTQDIQQGLESINKFKPFFETEKEAFDYHTQLVKELVEKEGASEKVVRNLAGYMSKDLGDHMRLNIEPQIQALKNGKFDFYGEYITRGLKEAGSIDIAESEAKNLILEKAELEARRYKAKQAIKKLENKILTNANDKSQAQITNSGIKEMLSAKALNQSVKNGFSQAKHIRAVSNIANLWEKAQFIENQAQKHIKDYVDSYKIYKAPFENAEAIISLQQRKVGNDILYFLKLENLQPSVSKQEGHNAKTQSLKSKVDAKLAPTLPSDDSKRILAQDSKNAKENLSIIKRENGDILVRDENGKAKIVRPAKEFGDNFYEYYHKGSEAIKKLLQEVQSAKANGNIESFKAQVAGAFYRKELGDIDLVWGDSSFGLRHILEKHGAEFENLAKNISEAIEKGEVVSQNNINTIWHKVGNDYYKAGLSKGFYGVCDNKWIITAYEKKNVGSAISESLSAPNTKIKQVGTFTSDTDEILPQNPKKI